jgi:hypothetical protein
MRCLVCLAQLTFCAYAGIFAQSIRLAALNTGKPADQRHVPRRVDRIEFPGARDLSHLSWIEAFDALHKLLVTEYPLAAALSQLLSPGRERTKRPQ